jgi:leucyl-tRNA synthetase
MEFLNVLSAAADRGSAPAGQLRESYETLLRLLHPFAPHITEELWQRLGHGEPIVKSGWPEWNRDLLAAQAVTIAVQVNGKLRGQVDVEPDADREAVEAAARANPSVARWLEGKNIVKVIVVPGRLVNFVVR